MANNSTEFEIMNKRIESLEEWRAVATETLEVQKQMVEVGHKIANALEVLSWVGHGLRWLTRIGLWFAAMWLAIRAMVSADSAAMIKTIMNDKM
jgi:hypothetical protein